MELYCDEPDCDRPVAGHGRGKCSTHLKQLQRTGKTAPIAEKLSPLEKTINAGTAFLEAEGDDEEYEAAKRAFILQAKSLGRAAAIEAIREGLRRAKAAGKRIGRRRKAEREHVLATFSEVLEVVGAAKAAEIAAKLHRISRRTVFRYLAVTKGELLTPNDGPRRAG